MTCEGEMGAAEDRANRLHQISQAALEAEKAARKLSWDLKAEGTIMPSFRAGRTDEDTARNHGNQAQVNQSVKAALERALRGGKVSSMDRHKFEEAMRAHDDAAMAHLRAADAFRQKSKMQGQSIIRQAQEAYAILGTQGDRILGPGGLSGASEATLQKLIREAEKLGPLQSKGMKPMNKSRAIEKMVKAGASLAVATKVADLVAAKRKAIWEGGGGTWPVARDMVQWGPHRGIVVGTSGDKVTAKLAGGPPQEFDIKEFQMVNPGTWQITRRIAPGM